MGLTSYMGGATEPPRSQRTVISANAVIADQPWHSDRSPLKAKILRPGTPKHVFLSLK